MLVKYINREYVNESSKRSTVYTLHSKYIIFIYIEIERMARNENTFVRMTTTC